MVEIASKARGDGDQPLFGLAVVHLLLAADEREVDLSRIQQGDARKRAPSHYEFKKGPPELVGAHAHAQEDRGRGRRGLCKARRKGRPRRPRQRGLVRAYSTWPAGASRP